MSVASQLPTDLAASRAASLDDVQGRLERLAAARHQSLGGGAYAEIARAFYESIRVIVRSLPVRGSGEALPRQALAGSFPAVVYLGDNARMAAEFLWSQTATQAILMGALDDDVAVELAHCLLTGHAQRQTRTVDPEQMATYALAAIDAIERDAAGRGVRHTLERLHVLLRLSWSKLGRMFGVSDETVRVWANGARNIPEERVGEIRQAGAALDRLTHMFLPERLAGVVRREPAPGFNGKAALDWILDGRIGEVADRYEAALMYQA